MKNAENTKNEITFEKENMNAIQCAVDSSENNGATSITLTPVSTGNDELDKLTTSLMIADALSEKVKAYKAVTLSYIKKNFARLGAKTGCKDIAEYGKKYLNYEKAQVNFLIQLSDKYIACNDSMNDTTMPAISDFKYNIVKDCDGYTMSIGQLQEIISVDKETVLDALASGAIDATSTQKELRAWKKAVKNTIDVNATDSNTGDTDSNTGDTDSNTGDADAETLVTDKDRLNAILNIANGIENDEIRSAMINAITKANKILSK